MTAPHFCPHCGFDLVADAPLISGEWTLSPGLAVLGGELLMLSAQEAALLFTLAKARGAPVRVEVIGARISGCEDPAALASVVLSRVAAKLGTSTPFENVWGRGYRWKAGPVAVRPLGCGDPLQIEEEAMP